MCIWHFLSVQSASIAWQMLKLELLYIWDNHHIVAIVLNLMRINALQEQLGKEQEFSGMRIDVFPSHTIVFHTVSRGSTKPARQHTANAST